MVQAKELESFVDTFDELEDPRIERGRLHPLPEVLLVTLCGVIAGCDGWRDIEDFAHQRLDFLRRFRPFEHGVPSDDTLRRVFRALDPERFAELFSRWAGQWYRHAGTPGDAQDSGNEPVEDAPRQIAIDGKTLRGSAEGGLGALHLVSAFATEARVVLGQRAVGEKSNEIVAIPELLEALDVRGATVTIDAMGCQRAIAERICAGGGDYVLALKDNQPALRADVELFFDGPPAGTVLDTDEAVDKGHGRIEVRRATVCTGLGWLRERHPGWSSLGAIVRIEAERRVGDATSVERRYYVASEALTAARAQAAVRSHWQIENALHWVLDMSFGEDASRVRRGHAVANLAVVRHAVLNAIRAVKEPRQSVKRMRKIAGWSEEALERVLRQLI